MDHQPFSTPLLCWDIFLEGYRRRIALAKDLRELNEFSRKNLWDGRWNFEDALIRKEKVVLVTDPDQQIRFASSNLLFMNGYLPEEVIGFTPRIFQGDDTAESSKSVVRSAVHERRPFSTRIVNYRKNGMAYHCHIDGYPVFNRRGDLVHFIAFEQIEEDVY